MKKNKKVQSIMAASAFAAFSATAALGATTPYDLIRPTWPLSWDAKVFDKFDTTGAHKVGMLPKEATPASFKAGELMPDTLDQAYLDAINTKISPIRVNQAGYLKSDTERQFYYVGTATEFEVVDAYGKSLSTKVTGTFKTSGVKTTSDWTIAAGVGVISNNEKRYTVNFTGPSGIIQVGNIPQSVPTDKRLRIKVGDNISSTFIISDDVYTMAKDASLKFFGIQRSGNSESWFHGPSHVKDGAGKVVIGTGTDAVTSSSISPKAGDLQGGWYDCGDHLKESQTQAFAFMALAVISATNPAKDVDHYAYNQGEFVKTDNIPDVLREAKHGADFFLRAYNVAKGVIDDMPVSIGNFGSDHSFWSRPETQDNVTLSGRGGPADRDIRLGELGSNVSGEIAAGLAILSKDYAKYDKDFADSCLTVAEKMYDFAKSLAQGKSSYDDGKPFVNNKKAAGWGSSAYLGNSDFEDELAIASVALLYATGKKQYADDALRNTELYSEQSHEDCAGCFDGGWFMTKNRGMLKNGLSTSWSQSHSYALYALYKLILADSKKAEAYGLTETERLAAIEDCLADMIINLSRTSKGTVAVTLPGTDYSNKNSVIEYDPTWYLMRTDFDWIFNRYHMGNIFDVLAYAEVAADIEKQGFKLPTMASTNLKASELKQLGINQLNYIFGVNPWDVSFVYGVGDKNDAHPHHRASNPEGRNTPGLNYKYTCPVGALFGGVRPDSVNSWTPGDDKYSWQNYILSETCLDASTVLLSALTLVSNGGSDYYKKECESCKQKETTPFEPVYATAYRYEFYKDRESFSINIPITNMNNLDSVVVYVYYDATEEDVNSCGVLFNENLCQAYDIVGFNHPCENDEQIRNSLRKSKPQKVEDTYNKDKGTYTWVTPIFIGDLAFGTRLRLDFDVSSGIPSDEGNTCELLSEPSKVKIADGWSFAAHKAGDNTPAYEGAPFWEKDQGDIQEAPKAPYIVIRSKGKWVWGYGPGSTTSDGFVKIAKATPSAHMQVSGRTLFVQATAQGTKTVKIFDVLGNQLLTQTFNGTSAQVDLANLPHRGAMIARLVSGNKLLAIKSIRIK